MNLDELRDALSQIDRQLVDLIAKRQRIVGDIGKFKQGAGTGTRDYAREKDVLDMARAQAEELGIDPDLAEGVLRQLIRSSLASQERDRVIAEGKGDGQRVLVIGASTGYGLASRITAAMAATVTSAVCQPERPATRLRPGPWSPPP